MCIRSVLSSHIVLHKLQIQALHNQFVDCPCASPHDIRCGRHMYADWMMAHHEAFNAEQKIPFHKARKQCVKKEPGKGNEVLFALSHSRDRCSLYVYYWYNVLLLIKVSMIFDQQVSALFFLAQFRKISFIPRFVHFLECNLRFGHPRKSSDCLLIRALHTWLGAIRGLCSRSEDCCSKLKSEVCTKQSVDCPHLYFAHNIYSNSMRPFKMTILCWFFSRMFGHGWVAAICRWPL